MAAQNADAAIRLILAHEGGYVNDPKDSGGPTNKGITLATYRRYIKRNGTIADLKGLTEAQAVRVYRRHYWDAVRADDLPSGVDYAVADFAVNSGPSRAARYLQAALAVPQDGRVGPVTIKAAHVPMASDTINHICDARLAFMRRIDRGRAWQRFGRGWQRRVTDVRAQSLAWASRMSTPVTTAPIPAPVKPIATVGIIAGIIALLTRIFGGRK